MFYYGVEIDTSNLIDNSEENSPVEEYGRYIDDDTSDFFLLDDKKVNQKMEELVNHPINNPVEEKSYLSRLYDKIVKAFNYLFGKEKSS